MNIENRMPIKDVHLDFASEIITTGVESPYVSDWATIEKYDWGWRNRYVRIGEDDPFDGTKQGIKEIASLPKSRETWASVTLIERDWDPRSKHKRTITLYPIDIARAMANVYSGELTCDKIGLAPIHVAEIVQAYHNPKADHVDFDAIDASNLIQIAWFGEVVYG